MQWSDYQHNAHRTSNTNTDPIIRLATAALGLTGEAAEVLKEMESPVQKDKLLKELGDTTWYIAEIASLSGLHLEAPQPSWPELGTHTTAMELLFLAAHLGDYLKKVIGHGHPQDNQRILKDLNRALTLIDQLTAAYGSSLPEICELNIAKLRKRYPEGFSTERSINKVESQE